MTLHTYQSSLKLVELYTRNLKPLRCGERRSRRASVRRRQGRHRALNSTVSTVSAVRASRCVCGGLNVRERERKEREREGERERESFSRVKGQVIVNIIDYELCTFRRVPALNSFKKKRNEKNPFKKRVRVGRERGTRPPRDPGLKLARRSRDLPR